MNRVRVVGGGLTGILAAFEARRLGAEVVLQERFEALGGVARPKLAHGRELRDGCVYFGPPDDPVRAALEAQGLVFEEVPNRMASVGPGEAAVRDFAGPSLPAGSTKLDDPTGARTLADRLACYPDGVRDALTRYVEWHVGVSPDALCAEAAIPLAINRVHPADMPPSALAVRKQTFAAWDELYGLPPQLWGRTANRMASLPVGGFSAIFDACARALAAAGVTVETGALVPPRQALLQAEANGEALVWAASPTPLFKAASLPTPPMVRKAFHTYVFRAAFTGALPFYLQNFTATGAVFRLYAYESGGEPLVALECVAEAEDRALRAEAAALMAHFPEEGLKLGELLSVSIQPRWIYHSPQTLEALAGLRQRLAARLGERFISGAWEPYAKAAKMAEVNAALAGALAPLPAVMSA